MRPSPRTTGSPHIAGGFTLIELLVVMVIITVLLGILLPTVGMVREQARRSACSGKLGQLSMATFTYMENNGGLLPECGSNSSHAFFGQPFSPPGQAAEDYLMGTVTYQQKIMKCPSNLNSPIRYSFHCGQPKDKPATLQRVMDCARRNGVPGGQVSLWADQCVTRLEIGNYNASCNHKQRVLGVDTGEPAGGNASFADGSVRWVPWTASAANGPAWGMAFNGYGFLNTSVVMFCDGSGNLITTELAFNVVVNLRQKQYAGAF